MASTRKRSALLVGCNYTGTQNELYGCINDVQTMQAILIDRFSMAKKDIKIMTDAADSSVKPTGMNIRKALVKMIHEAKKDDILFFYFSGFGTVVPRYGSEQSTVSCGGEQSTVSCGDEQSPALVSCDFHIIKDDEFRLLVNHLPEGATFTFLSDSSHSGGLIYEEKEQRISDATGPEPNNDWEAYHRSKTFPFNVNSGVQSSGAPISGIQSSDIGMLLSEVFGSEASANFSSGNSQSGMSCSDNGILLSSCKLIQKSVEVDPNNNQSNAYGAFTNAIKMVLDKYRGQITNKELVTLARDYLCLEGIGQHPRLYCSDMNEDEPFLEYVIGKSE